MIAFALAALLVATPGQDPGTQRVPPSAPPAQAVPADDPIALEDVEVTGTPLDSMIRNFVNEVAAPNRGRGLARWSERICVGVANLRSEPAQYIVDRVSTVAEDIGLTPGQPGCTPNVIIIASDDPDSLARTLTEERRRAFQMGGAGMDRGGDALEDFVTSDAPVRWWQVSMPTNSETGARATRLSGECRASCNSNGGSTVMDYAPIVQVFAASRLNTQIVDNIIRTVVILDVDQVSRVSGQQLADYVTMVTLAQIDPAADTSGYASILNLFGDPDAAAGLTDWDQAYLGGLYDAERNKVNLRAGKSEIADSIQAAHRNLQDAAAD